MHFLPKKVDLELKEIWELRRAGNGRKENFWETEN